MAYTYIGKEFGFSAGHQLYEPLWTQTENWKTWGKCTRQHGHNYRITVEVGGETRLQDGMVFNYDALTMVVNEVIILNWDHYFLNELPDFKGIRTTAENMVDVAWRLLEDKFPAGIQLTSVMVKETDASYARRFK